MRKRLTISVGMALLVLARSATAKADEVTDWNLIFAALLISIVPILAVYFALQRSIINGFAGGLKG